MFGEPEHGHDPVEREYEPAEHATEEGREAGPADQVEGHAAGRVRGFGVLDPEPFRPRGQRTPEQHVDADHHHDHHDDREQHPVELAVVTGRGDEGTDAG